ncbi:MAG: twin-arginine translocation signal domain-containing protein [Acidimicrobiia bacterium]|nr:twin-arginine translocation signal domain-containing protein [Acidimicrobiia bacterium]MDH4306500.1 twin-arginine translocation signal domain-containing protein [Acidimicrobiia bacterium]MDH5292656.1 twin-arginine translocation signal domain-containing protein [Acidimicrobiia bacterium]
MGMITRREFLKRTAIAAAVAGAPAGVLLARPAPALAATERISGSQTVTTKTVAAGDVLEFDPDVSTTLTLTGSGDTTMLVEGTLRMRPSSASVVHTIRFTGGGELIVNGGGRLDIQGTQKTGWNRTGDDPTWSATDQLIVAPIAKGDYTFRSFTKGSSVPQISNRHGSFAAEVMNLTRNVVIEGTTSTPMRRIMMIGSAPQTIKYAEVRHAGDPDEVGFYPIHFHLMGEGARGSIVQGTVVHNAHHHAFVVHGSHGVTLRDCVAYDVEGDAYWWDLPPEGDFGNRINNTHDVLYEDCIAADVHRTDLEDPVTRPNELSGFLMGAGTNNTARRCVAVGIGGGVRTSGFHWPSKANAQTSPWVFEDCRTHNSREHGIFVWQNTDSERHGIDRFVSFHNGLGPVKHGAYNNRGYHYRNCLFFGNGGGFEQNAQTATKPGKLTAERLSFEECIFDDTDGESLLLRDHNLAPSMYTLYLDSQFASTIRVADNDRLNGWYDFVRCNVETGDFDTSAMNSNSIIRVQRTDGTAFELTRSGSRTIPAFWDGWSSFVPKPGEEFPDWDPTCGNR